MLDFLIPNCLVNSQEEGVVICNFLWCPSPGMAEFSVLVDGQWWIYSKYFSKVISNVLNIIIITIFLIENKILAFIYESSFISTVRRWELKSWMWNSYETERHGLGRLIKWTLGYYSNSHYVLGVCIIKTEKFMPSALVFPAQMLQNTISSCPQPCQSCHSELKPNMGLVSSDCALPGKVPSKLRSPRLTLWLALVQRGTFTSA